MCVCVSVFVLVCVICDVMERTSTGTYRQMDDDDDDGKDTYYVRDHWCKRFERSRRRKTLFRMKVCHDVVHKDDGEWL